MSVATNLIELARELQRDPPTTTHTSHMCRLWKAMGCPVGLSDATLIRKAAVRIHELEREVKALRESRNAK